MRQRSAQEVIEADEGKQYQDRFQRAGQNIAQLEQAANRPARSAASADEFGAHENGHAGERESIGPVDRLWRQHA